MAARGFVYRKVGRICRAERAQPSEKKEQIKLAKWLDFVGVVWIHIPNEGRRDGRMAKIQEFMGLKKGFPDNLIFNPTIVSNDEGTNYVSSGVALELKRVKGGEVSVEQSEWLSLLGGLGWHCIVARGAEDAIKQLQALGIGVRK